MYVWRYLRMICICDDIYERCVCVTISTNGHAISAPLTQTLNSDNSCSVLQCVAVCCSVLQCVAVCCSVLQCVAVCYSVLQCVAVCCSVLQCVALCCAQLRQLKLAKPLTLNPKPYIYIYVYLFLSLTPPIPPTLFLSVSKDELQASQTRTLQHTATLLLSISKERTSSISNSQVAGRVMFVSLTLQVSCSVLQCVAVRCSVLQCVAVCCK